MTRLAQTSAPLHPLLAERWSPRALDADLVLSDHQLVTLLEAARWSPSAGNSQPWRFGVARRGEPAYDALFAALAPGNQLWAGTAAALVLMVADLADDAGQERPWALYDTGQAAAHLSIQAQALGLAVHQLGGFDVARAADVFDLAPSERPVTVLVIGRHDPERELPEPFATRESAPRERLPLAELRLTPTVAVEQAA